MPQFLDRIIFLGLSLLVTAGAMPARGQGDLSPKRIIGVEFKILAEDFREGFSTKLGDVEADLSADIEALVNRVEHLGFVEWMSVKTIVKNEDKSRLGGTLIAKLVGKDFGGFGEQISLQLEFKDDQETVPFPGRFDTPLYQPVSDQPTGDRTKLREDVHRVVCAKLGLRCEEGRTPSPPQPERIPDFVNQILHFLGAKVALARNANIPQKNKPFVEIPLLQRAIGVGKGSGMDIRFETKIADNTLKILVQDCPPLYRGRTCGIMTMLEVKELDTKTHSPWSAWFAMVFDSHLENTVGIYMTKYVWRHDNTGDDGLQQ